MGKLPILPRKATSFDSREPYPSNEALPPFYMAEYSVTGLWVGDFAAVSEILEQNHFVFSENSDVVEVQIESPAEIQRVLRVLRERGLDFEMSDIIDQVYQG